MQVVRVLVGLQLLQAGRSCDVRDGSSDRTGGGGGRAGRAVDQEEEVSGRQQGGDTAGPGDGGMQGGGTSGLNVPVL